LAGRTFAISGRVAHVRRVAAARRGWARLGAGGALGQCVPTEQVADTSFTAVALKSRFTRCEGGYGEEVSDAEAEADVEPLDELQLPETSISWPTNVERSTPGSATSFTLRSLPDALAELAELAALEELEDVDASDFLPLMFVSSYVPASVPACRQPVSLVDFFDE